MTLSVCKSRIVVAVSGGVDSSVAAYLLTQQLLARSKHERQVEQNSNTTTSPSSPSFSTSTSHLIGLFMNNWDSSDEGATSYCANSEKDWQDAQSVCSLLRLPLYRANFSSEYWTEVFTPFLQAIPETTPNPDMLCNSIIKFGAMKNYALHRFNATCIATGHYARLWRRQREEWMEEWKDDIRGLGIDSSNKRQTLQEELYASGSVPDWVENWGIGKGDAAVPPMLVAGADSSKDQSYFLSMTPGLAFKNVLFPLGYLRKQNTTRATQQSNKHQNTNNSMQSLFYVRDIAAQAGLFIVKKKDSSGICFIGKRKFPKFISGYLPLEAQKEGNFVCIDTGKVSLFF
jgi:tRNA U34 2-thiouridine synthase MnmA/TrmU